MPILDIIAPQVVIADDYANLCRLVADRIQAVLHDKPNAVLGLATGSTPIGVYDLLAQRYAEGTLDFSQVICFNLDEYYPMHSESLHSYHHFMQKHLFSRINCPHWFVPDGRPRSEAQIAQDCRDYEERIADAGGIDLQLLGIGRSGHIGFNEPGSAPDSRTNLVTLDPITREDASSSFGSLEAVPQKAITMGIGTILDAHEIVVMATGAAKAEIVRTAWHGDMTDQIPASWLRTHSNVRLYLDPSAAALMA